MILLACPLTVQDNCQLQSIPLKWVAQGLGYEYPLRWSLQLSTLYEKVNYCMSAY